MQYRSLVAQSLREMVVVVSIAELLQPQLIM
jgi:hypothetical protein